MQSCHRAPCFTRKNPDFQKNFVKLISRIKKKSLIFFSHQNSGKSIFTYNNCVFCELKAQLVLCSDYCCYCCSHSPRLGSSCWCWPFLRPLGSHEVPRIWGHFRQSKARKGRGRSPFWAAPVWETSRHFWKIIITLYFKFILSFFLISKI